ncbi:MAG: hypothetical protein HY517_04720 [Candidatus Aenigmarchaeota archaeon]|nr:hypothetical protein [Candidatus Aenigmarchaeota archaeon]
MPYKGISVQYARDIPFMMRSPFSLVPMRAEITSGRMELDDGRKRLLEYVAEKSLEQGRRTLLAGIRAGDYFKGPIGPYDMRSFAVLQALEEMAEKDARIRTVGRAGKVKEEPGFREDPNTWPDLAIVVYEYNPDGMLDMRVIPSHDPIEESPIMPLELIREYGLIFTGRPENVAKWTEAGFSVEQTPAEFVS